MNTHTAPASIRQTVAATIARHMKTEGTPIEAAAAAAEDLNTQAIALGWDVDTRAALLRYVAEFFVEAATAAATR